MNDEVSYTIVCLSDEPRSERTSSGFLTRCDTNQAVQSQKMARSLKFRI